MKKLLLILPALLSGCGTLQPIKVKPTNPLRVLPFIQGVAESVGNGAAPDGHPDWGWMYHVFALVAVGFAAAVSFLAGRFTKSAKLLLVIGGGVSIWAFSVEAIQPALILLAPWALGGFILLGLIDTGFRTCQRIKNRGKPPACEHKIKDRQAPPPQPLL